MELRHLRYFVAAAEELNFSRAARRVHVSQPPLSRQIALLEQEMGVRLFERGKHGVQLTTAGAAFLDDARGVLAGAGAAVSSAQRAARGEIGRLSIGFVASASYALLPHVLREFRLRHPDVKLVLRTLDITQQIDALHANRIDVGIVRMPISDSALETELLVRERFVVALPRDHELAGRGTLSLKALADERFITSPSGGEAGFYNQSSLILSMCQWVGFIPNVVQEVRPTQTMIALVSAGIGIAIVPASAQSIRVKGVVYRPLSDRHAITEFALAWRRADTSPILRAFSKIVAESVKTFKKKG